MTLVRHSLFVLHHSFWERRSHFCYCNKPETNRDQEERKKLATREGTDQLRVGFAEIFYDASKDRVANKKEACQNSIGLASARPHKPQNREQNDSLEERLVNLRRMAR